MLTEKTARALASTGRIADISPERSLHGVADLATRGIPGCAATVVVVWAGERARETFVSHPDLGELFELQQRSGCGPTHEARRTRHAVVVTDTLREHRWPRYASMAVRYGVRSTLVLPLEVGALTVTVTLCGVRPHAWNEQDVHPLSSLLATQLTVALEETKQEIVELLAPRLDTAPAGEELLPGTLQPPEALDPQ